MQLVRQLPNLLTLLRVVLTLPIAWLLIHGVYGWALWLFALAGVTDGLDGYLARRFGWFSRFGAMLDPLADKLLLVTSYLCLSISGAMPLWLTVAVLGRDLLIVCGAGLYRWRVGPLRFSPSLWGKLSTVLQIVLVLALLLELSILPAFSVVTGALQWLVLALCLLSGGHYAWLWSGKYRAAQHSNRP